MLSKPRAFILASLLTTTVLLMGCAGLAAPAGTVTVHRSAWGVMEAARIRIMDRPLVRLRAAVVRELGKAGFDVDLPPNPTRVDARCDGDGEVFSMDLSPDGNFPISPIRYKPRSEVQQGDAVLLVNIPPAGQASPRDDTVGVYAPDAKHRANVEQAVRRAKLAVGIRGCWVGQHVLHENGPWGPTRCSLCGCFPSEAASTPPHRSPTSCNRSNR